MLIRSLTILAAATGLAAAGHAVAQPYDHAGPAYGDRPAYESGPAVDELTVRGRFARPGAEVRAWRVGFADLDLDSPYGAHTLLVRIHGAAQQVCSPEPVSHTDFNDADDYRDCMNDAVARAVGEVDAPTLNEVYSYDR